MTVGVHGTTYGGNPLAMAVAASVLNVMLEKDFFANVKKSAAEFRTVLEEIKSEHSEIIDEIRGVGLMLGIKINDKIEHLKLVEKFIANGLLTIPAGNNVIRIIPPLIINSEHIIEAQEKIINSLKYL